MLTNINQLTNNIKLLTNINQLTNNINYKLIITSKI